MNYLTNLFKKSSCNHESIATKEESDSTIIECTKCKTIKKIRKVRNRELADFK